MLKKFFFSSLLYLTPFIINAGTIPFCVNNKNVTYPQFTLDSKKYYYNVTNSVHCFDHTPVGNNIVLFTNGFDLNFNNFRCGKTDPCIIPMKNISNLTKISVFVASENNIISGTLYPEYV